MNLYLYPLDCVCVDQVGSKRRFVVEHTNNYLGEMDLNMNKIMEEQRNAATWNEMKTAYQRNVNVMVRAFFV